MIANPYLDLGSLAPGGAFGKYYPEGSIRFDSRSAHDWEFMATGTGVTGVTVNCPGELEIQVNHSASIDEAADLRALARLHLDLEGQPFSNATRFHMEHDLHRSVITTWAETPAGMVRVEIRASVPEDILRIDVFDERRGPGKLTIHLEEDAPMQLNVGEHGEVFFWHENPKENIGPVKAEDGASGQALPVTNQGFLAGRVFGLAIATGNPAALMVGHILSLPVCTRQTIYLAGVSTLGGWEAFSVITKSRLAKAISDGPEAFIASHEDWWREFWAQASFKPEDQEGVLLRQKAAFDLYRYYLACCGGERRETPPRFQIDLFRYHLRQHGWLTGLICAIEQYQSFYGAMRTGNWEALRGLAGYYTQKIAYYQYFAWRNYGHGGARIPMWEGPTVVSLPEDTRPDTPPLGVLKSAYNGENPAGQIWNLLLFCDCVDITGDHRFAEQILRPLATNLVEFIRLQYPDRQDGRMVIAPCNAGETWQGVRDPSEMVCALRSTLPRLITIARAEDCSPELVATWEEMLAAVPDIPLGRLDYQGPDVLPAIVPADRLAPAADMSACEAYDLPWGQGKPLYQLNAQQTELYAIWPAKLVLQDPAQREIAIQSYRERLWTDKRDGWNLDAAFASCLGLVEDALQEFAARFDHTFSLPCGLARETAPVNPASQVDSGNWIPESPSLQGMGTGVIPVLEMLLQDYPERLVVLPCWPEQVPVKFCLYSPYAGKVEVNYQPGKWLEVKLERQVPVSSPLEKGAPVRIVKR
jgi:hypothetical protein